MEELLLQHHTKDLKIMLWFVKSRRAQSVDDYETWLQGGVVPTINQFDGGDTRATVLILTDPILMRDREGKAGGEGVVNV